MAIEAPDLIELSQLCDFAETRLAQLSGDVTSVFDDDPDHPPSDWEKGCLAKTRAWLDQLHLLTPADKVRLATDMLAEAGLEVEAQLVISTSHITEETAGVIEAETQKDNNPFGLIAYAKGEYGWMMYVDDYAMKLPGVPDELDAAIKMAHHLGCKWLVLDRDGPVITNLSTFDW